MSRETEFTAWAQQEIPRLRRFAAAVCADQYAGEDVLQNVLTSVFVRWGRIDDVNAYATRSIVNGSVSRWRSGTRRREVPWTAASEADQFQDPDDGYLSRSAALGMLSGLPRQQRAVLALRHLEGYSEAETAEILDISTGTVKSYHSRAVAALRKNLGIAAS